MLFISQLIVLCLKNCSTYEKLFYISKFFLSMKNYFMYEKLFYVSKIFLYMKNSSYNKDKWIQLLSQINLKCHNASEIVVEGSYCIDRIDF